LFYHNTAGFLKKEQIGVLMEPEKIPQIEADILIIGGGSAGAMAAIRAKEINPELSVVIFEKGDFEYSGSIPRGMDALNIVTVPGVGSPEEFVASNRVYCDQICDDPEAYILAKRSYPLMQKLIDWGVCFPKKDGNYDIISLHPGKRFTVSMIEPNLKQLLVKKTIESGCRVENRTMAIALLNEGEVVSGAVGLNVRTGELIACIAKAVILSAGGTARFGLPPSASLYGTYDFPGNTGDGYLLGYRAGAKLTNMEFTMCFLLLKDLEAPGMSMMIQKGARLLNVMGQGVMENKYYDGSDVNTIQNSPAGPLRLRLSHLPQECIEEIEHLVFSCERPIIKRFLEHRGLDLRQDDIELATSEIFLCGGHGLAGLVVDEQASTCVPGLYAAGDTAPIRGFLTGAFVFGELAAESATEFVRDRGRPIADKASYASVLEKLDSFRSNSDGRVSVHNLEFKVRRHINEYLTPPKNDYKMRRLMDFLKVFRNDLKKEVMIKTQRDMFLAIEVENIIDSAYLSTVASLERKESRWGFWHQRSDHPKKDEANWLKHIDLSFDPGSDKPQTTWLLTVKNAHFAVTVLSAVS
jgi:succinate dehydrogenase/fumarate reductase flavoprotein subunit